jgi:hypothetical protein
MAVLALARAMSAEEYEAVPFTAESGIAVALCASDRSIPTDVAKTEAVVTSDSASAAREIADATTPLSSSLTTVHVMR